MRSRITSRLVACTCLLGIALNAGTVPASAQAVTGWTDKQQAKRAEQFARLTPEHFARTAEAHDDELEVVATIDTQKGHRFKGAFKDPVRTDTFLRALVNKRSGAALYQLYASLTYTGEWRTFTSATYVGSEGPVSAPLKVIRRDVDCQYGGCIYVEHVAIEISGVLLEELATRAAERPVKPWRFRFKARNGQDWTDDMAPAEAAGLLLAVERYRAKTSE
ncbi:hypothetical protein [Qipengyuania oceanensis]|uniref:Uncharacterized protein n=1 Tax=Qipengyuania oceanensis TaxID=1463597 RepID=A0A844YLP7_9SPHN|nr:hypothetical protein [Qipengyuania oceanensis]MXO63948.1 hypothetical protein [Qipengyuania oceanensis]